MNRTAIYNFVTSLLFGYQMDETTFEAFLDVAQDQVEISRPWIVLRAEDSSLSVGTSNDFTVAFTIAPTNSDFSRWIQATPTGAPIVLTDSQNNPQGFLEVPLAQKFSYKDAGAKLFCDYGLKKFYLCGKITQSYTIHQFYLKKSAQVSANANNIWLFDSYGYSFSKVLGFLIALQWKGVDYDIINLQNAGELGKAAAGILDQMTRWDSELQQSMQAGKDPFASENGLWSANSGGGILTM